MLELNKIYNEDCLGDKEKGTGMWRIPDKSIDMILCDLPYGITRNKWDNVIDLDKLWEHYKRIIKDNGAIVLTASQPFTTKLISSNMSMFKYCWVWKKSQVTGFLNAKKQPLREHEDICVFYKKQCTYNPQMIVGKMQKKNTGGKSSNYNDFDAQPKINNLYYPKTIIDIPLPRFKNGHPTQKPVALFEYLIKTYTNEGEIVLDNCMGSGTTAIACINTNRKYIGFEIEKEYYDLAIDRINKHLHTLNKYL